MLSEESVLDKRASRVKLVDDRICVPLLADSEHGHFVVNVDCPQTFLNKRPYVNGILLRLLRLRLCNFYPHELLSVH